MRNKHIILFGLLSAYLLMFAHSVIPHHHHDSTKEAEHHHHTEHAAHHHEHEESEGHGHTTHFVHPPDFGNYVVPGLYKLNNLFSFNIDIVFTAPTIYNLSYQPFIAEVDWFPDSPPPYKNYNPLSHSLRGPPPFISLA
jgi:hypothetical protein